MPGGGTRTFLEPDHYEASLRQAQIEAVIVPRDKFSARLTWGELHHLQVLLCEEDSPRLAYLQLAPSLAFVTFPAGFEPLPVWRGREIQPSDIMFHSRGERLHQSTSGPSVWNVIAMDPAQLERYGRALSGKPFSWPLEGRVFQLSPNLATRLPRLHAQICSPSPDQVQDVVAFRGRAGPRTGFDPCVGRLFDDGQRPNCRVRQPASCQDHG